MSIAGFFTDQMHPAEWAMELLNPFTNSYVT